MLLLAAQSDVTPLHVLSVKRTEEPPDHGDKADTINAIVQSDTTEYKIHCYETFSKEETSYPCFQISAGKDYDATIWPLSISFAGTKPYQQMYEIDEENPR